MSSAIVKPHVADLVLDLLDFVIKEDNATGNVRLRATARTGLSHRPPNGDRIRSEPFGLTCIIGPIEKDDLVWYLKRYHRWPTGTLMSSLPGISRGPIRQAFPRL